MEKFRDVLKKTMIYVNDITYVFLDKLINLTKRIEIS